ncbi:hypothetical protein M2454_002760 [Aequitasia blattaphilus]|uniref:Ribonuclease Z n=1 Tax=Aequitasia blattaphilus TaxID=2949332 RepID=A0ABT1EC19_9FIRM|nr:ribonuclease Z [Aequitasia blattaphilus]MCP1103375.1 ribonuclease Z [Aequitasia blattaphilus]MCR8616015.1 ribonuclease Z [Aequitasia blattaphilus]
MIVIACVDDALGMMFNKRRQSKDKVLQKEIMEATAGKKLWMNQYSLNQFQEEFPESHILCDEDFLNKAAEGDYCFVENISLKSYEEKIEKIILYKWNRKYPADFFFDISINENGWKIIESEEFPGYSHEKITKEVYGK